MSATDFGIETPSKRSQLAQVLSTSPGTTPTSVAGQIWRKYHRMQVQHSQVSSSVARSPSKMNVADGMPAISKNHLAVSDRA